MDQIKITLGEVSNMANQLRLINANLDDVLDYVKKMMADLNGVWSSPGATAIMNRFDAFASRFVKESQTIDSYARFLDYTVASYDSLEATIEANAATF